MRGAARERRRHDIRRGHQSIGVLMMLVDAEAVEAHTVGELELVEVVVIKAMAELGIVEVARNIHPYAAVLILEAIGQEEVRHQHEPRKFHKGLLPPWPIQCECRRSA